MKELAKVFYHDGRCTLSVFGDAMRFVFDLHRFNRLIKSVHVWYEVNLMSIGYGLIAGWPSTAFGILQANDAPIASGPLNIEELSWVGSIMCLGGAFGNVFFGWLTDRIGRKKPILLSAFFQAVKKNFHYKSIIHKIYPIFFIQTSWALIIFATCPLHLLIARFLGGFSGGGSLVLNSLFVAEIADDKLTEFNTIKLKLRKLYILYFETEFEGFWDP